MTREEAIASYEKLYAYMVGDDDAIELDYGEFMELNHYIRSALRPVSREQVEKSWVGCGYCGNRGMTVNILHDICHLIVQRRTRWRDWRR